MGKLSSSDLKILYHLDLNSKQSLRALGKKVQLSKSVVQYRIKRLEQLGIIKHYYTNIDFFKLGYIQISIQIIFQYYTPEIEQELINHFSNHHQTWFVANVQGKYDLFVQFSVKNMNNFFSFWKKTLQRFRFHIEQADISFSRKIIHVPKTYLTDDHETCQQHTTTITSNSTPYNLQELDTNILKELLLNPRQSSTDIAKTYNTSSVTIANHIRKLEKQNIIKGYTIDIDYTKLGLQLFNVQYTLKRYDNLQKIIEYAMKNPHLISINEVIGNYDLSMNYHIKDFSILHPIINDVLTRFPDDIKNRISTSYPTIYKQGYLNEFAQKSLKI